MCPITDGDVDRVSAFLQESMGSNVPASSWARSLREPRNTPKPNNGFQLLDGDTVVGAYLAYYSRRPINGKTEDICNLGAWSVRADHRFHSVRLLKALLAQDGYHFVDLSPSGNVVPLNERLGFRFLDTATALAPTFPWPWRPARVSGDPAVIERTLTGPDLRIYRDHRDAAAARHVVLRRGDRWCYVVFRMDRRKKLPRVFASVLHVSDPELFRALGRQFRGYLLARHGALAILAELRIVGHRPAPSVMLPSPRRKMYRSPTLHSADIDYFYSELVSVPW